MRKISKTKTNPYIISAIAIFFAVYISGFLYYYCFSAYPAAVYAQIQSKDNFNDISKRPTAAVNSTSQGPEPQIAVPSISTKDLNNTSDIQSSEVDDKYVEELFEAEPEDNIETGSEIIDNEKTDEKQGTKNLEEKGDNKQADRDQQQQKRQASDESASTGSIAEEEEEGSIEKPEKGEKQEQADSKEEKEEEKKPDKTGDKDSTDSDKGGEQKIEDRDEIEEGEEQEEEIEEGEEQEEEMKEELDDEPKDEPSDDTPLELPFP